MTKNAPRSATELFIESFRLSPKQRNVMDQLRTFEGGARASQLAERVGVHINTARGHLEELVEMGAVEAVAEPAKGRGRPALLFRVRTPDNREVAAEHISLINTMAKFLADDTPEGREKAREIGRTWARDVGVAKGTSADASTQELINLLCSLGFDPTQCVKSNGAREIGIRSCPFVSRDIPVPSMTICAIHQGFIQEYVHEDDVDLELLPLATDAMCRVTIGGQQAS